VIRGRLLLIGVAALGLGVGLAYLRPWAPRLQVIRKGGAGPPDFMLLHGYGSGAESWLPFAQTIPFPAAGRFLFPQGPEIVRRTDSLGSGHAWWDLDLAAHLRPGKPGVDLTTDDPAGLLYAAKLVRGTLDRWGNSARRPFVLGGFSQGAMVSCQVAFASREPLAALVVLSGTKVDRTRWRDGMAGRKGLPIFMAHGRQDDILPFDLADQLRQEMVQTGLAVTFVPFDGGHEIPREVVIALGNFLAGIAH
jgi:phospholipase/carboxylesterase